MRNNGATVKYQGVAGPVTDSHPASIKRRNIDWHLSGDAMSDILDAYYAGGEAAAIDALGQAMADRVHGQRPIRLDLPGHRLDRSEASRRWPGISTRTGRCHVLGATLAQPSVRSRRPRRGHRHRGCRSAA